MSRNGKVIVAMSGGVDSSVAAWMLKQQGYECLGVFMRIGQHAGAADSCPSDGRRLRHGCCSAADAADARAIAGRLGIPFYVLDFEREFDQIVDYFVDEYVAGRTPNPCIVCNIRLKFGRLLQYADLVDAQYVATGHYARVLPGPQLARAKNAAKDQSYVLFGIRRSDLGRCLFPLGEVDDKAQVRAVAAELGLRVHDKPDSQEICFVPQGDYRELIRQRRPEAFTPGELRDTSGRVLGRHQGLAAYTIGQRRGLGIAAGEPLYVTRLDVLDNAVIVGRREALLRERLIAAGVNWLADPPPAGCGLPCHVKIRYTHCPAAARLTVLPEAAEAAGSPQRVEVVFEQPQPAVTPGQAAVFYDDQIVLGGGWIERQ